METASSNDSFLNCTVPCLHEESESEFLLPASNTTVILLSVLFFSIGTVGILGNAMVIIAVLSDAKMRASSTNVLIANLATSDLIVMIACIPDIIQFIGNKGWILGLNACRFLRFVEVFALYSSVMTLVTVCIERYVAIMRPIHAHVICHRSRIVMLTCVIWLLAMVMASPNLVWHTVKSISPAFSPCIIQFPSKGLHLVFKFGECLTFYLIPLVLQTILYIRIGRNLFRKGSVLTPSSVGKQKYDGAIQTRKGVIKMLVAGVAVYFLSFSPHQILLFYKTFSNSDFQETWPLLIFVNVMAYSSSAANPLLYSIFSQKFRSKFRSMVRCQHGHWFVSASDGSARSNRSESTEHSPQLTVRNGGSYRSKRSREDFEETQV